ncbi:MAG: hypothetical protein WBY93_00830 [Candidatus Binatus sp.]
MTASKLAKTNTRDSYCWTGEPYVHDPDIPTGGLGPLCRVEMEFAGESRLDRKTALLFEQTFDAPDCTAAGPQGNAIWIFRRQLEGDFVGPYDFVDF